MRRTGDGTPYVTWQVYASEPDDALSGRRPRGIRSEYWMPYSSPYGMHDSPWQKFGSSLYKSGAATVVCTSPQRP